MKRKNKRKRGRCSLGVVGRWRGGRKMKRKNKRKRKGERGRARERDEGWEGY